jgi:hypothetical protein
MGCKILKEITICFISVSVVLIPMQRNLDLSKHVFEHGSHMYLLNYSCYFTVILFWVQSSHVDLFVCRKMRRQERLDLVVSC